MRSLFLKIFIWFWIAMALVVLAHAVSTMMVFDERPRRMLMDRLAAFGLIAAEEYERAGKAAADKYLGLLERTARTRAYLFDETSLARYFSSPVIKLRAATQQLAAGDLFNTTRVESL